jgi:hypothetical protein
MSIVQIALRSLQFLFTLLTTALIGNAIHDAFSGNPSGVNFAIFVDVLCWLVLIYGVLTAVKPSFAIKIVSFVADGLAALFSFIAAVVLSAKLGVHSCGNSVRAFLLHFKFSTSRNFADN